jgi:hypothetical protein
LRLDEVSIGSAAQIRIATIDAAGGPGNLFSDKKSFGSLELDSLVINEEGLGWVLLGRPSAQGNVFGLVRAHNVRIDSKHLGLPVFDIKMQTGGDAGWTSMSVDATDKSISLNLVPQEGAVALDINARSFKLPFGSKLTLEDFIARGKADRNELSLTEFKAFLQGGTLTGNARLTWGDSWSLGGELAAARIDTSLVLPNVLKDARLDATTTYAMASRESAGLFASPRLEGTISISRGILLGIDMGRFLQGGGMIGDTRFADLAGTFVHDRGMTRLTQLRFSDDALFASGTAEADAGGNVSGRLVVDLRLGKDQRRTRLGISGSLDAIQWRP